jgi:hypothetical protein
VAVTYAYEAGSGERCIYAGQGSFDQPGEEDVASGTEVLVREDATVYLYVRVVARGGTVRDAERDAEAVGRALVAQIRKQAYTLLGVDSAGTHPYVRVTGGQASFTQDDDQATAILGYRITTSSYV